MTSTFGFAKNIMLVLVLFGCLPFSVFAEDWYLTGPFIGFSPNEDYRFTEQTDGSYTISLDELRGAFLITNSTQEIIYGANGAELELGSDYVASQVEKSGLLSSVANWINVAGDHASLTDINMSFTPSDDKAKIVLTGEPMGKDDNQDLAFCLIDPQKYAIDFDNSVPFQKSNDDTYYAMLTAQGNVNVRAFVRCGSKFIGTSESVVIDTPVNVALNEDFFMFRALNTNGVGDYYVSFTPGDGGFYSGKMVVYVLPDVYIYGSLLEGDYLKVANAQKYDTQDGVKLGWHNLRIYPAPDGDGTKGMFAIKYEYALSGSVTSSPTDWKYYALADDNVEGVLPGTIELKRDSKSYTFEIAPGLYNVDLFFKNNVPDLLVSKVSQTVVEGLEVNYPQTAVEYYNMQGFRVDGNRLAPGVYIKSSCEKVSKIVVR